ncbi:MAG TPA: hypothetical protein VHH73_17040 [Verrucomicrobiae bacterium]|nr:hypothetical protein [Verrucomicrobiae bacterium]
MKFSDLWNLHSVIGRRAYFLWGFILFAIKFNVDRLLALGMTGGSRWSLRETLALYLWQPFPSGELDRRYYLALLLVSLPFLWAGLIITLGRLRSIGWRPWWLLLFFVPALKLVFFTLLCFLPKRDSAKGSQTAGLASGGWTRFIPHSKLENAVLASFISVTVAMVGVWLGTAIFGNYGWSLFLGIPFLIGLLAATLNGVHGYRNFLECISVAIFALLLNGLGLLVIGVEGGICLLMALPVAIVPALIGGAIGYAIQRTFPRRAEAGRVFSLGVMLIPVMMAIEHVAPPPLPLLRVSSSVVVNASPETVWRNVVTFADVPPPKEWVFKLGVAYPLRAVIQGQGVGAVRHCVFSTGPFVEPIEIWDEPRLLKFSVTKNPEPMQEWTPYRDIHPAHLDGYFVSQEGQFRLVPLEGGQTLLEGTTWYYHHLWPAKYWQLWSDYIIHHIHLQVLRHVKNLSERPVVVAESP